MVKLPCRPTLLKVNNQKPTVLIFESGVTEISEDTITGSGVLSYLRPALDKENCAEHYVCPALVVGTQ